MTAIPDVHERYGGIVTSRAGTRVVAHYGQPDRTYRAVRNVVGVIEHGYGVVTVRGAWRRETVADRFTNDIPEDEKGAYGFVVQDGTIVADAYVFDVGDRMLAFVPADRAQFVAEHWDSDGVVVDVATREFSIFGVHGPKATEKVASVFTGSAPEPPLTIARGAIRDVGATIVRDDDIAGEEGYFVVAASADAEQAFDALINYGLNAAPFGYETWNQLTLEAGTPQFDTELADVDPSTVGFRTAYPTGACPTSSDRQLRGFRAEAVPDAEATVYAADDPVGHVTRATNCSALEMAIGFAVVDPSVAWPVTIGADRIDARAASLPFVDGSDRSTHIPGVD